MLVWVGVIRYLGFFKKYNVWTLSSFTRCYSPFSTSVLHQFSQEVDALYPKRRQWAQLHVVNEQVDHRAMWRFDQTFSPGLEPPDHFTVRLLLPLRCTETAPRIQPQATSITWCSARSSSWPWEPRSPTWSASPAAPPWFTWATVSVAGSCSGPTMTRYAATRTLKNNITAYRARIGLYGGANSPLHQMKRYNRRMFI